MRKNHIRMLELLDNGMLDKDYLISALLGWMDDSEILQLAQANDIELYPEDDEEESEE